MQLTEFLGIFILISGFIIGLGAVTVIDIHGFLGRKSQYWSEATIRTHKVTKPLIWLGTFLVVLGGCIFYRGEKVEGIVLFHIVSLPVLVLNGSFLSFYVSPFLLNREKEGRATELLPQSIQNKITVSFLVSFVLWWGNLGAFVYYLLNNF